MVRTSYLDGSPRSVCGTATESGLAAKRALRQLWVRIVRRGGEDAKAVLELMKQWGGLDDPEST